MRLSEPRTNRALILLGMSLAATTPSWAQDRAGAPLRGDVDGDGEITLNDARLLSRYLVTRQAAPGIEPMVGDVNGDGRITAVDVAIIQRFAAGRDVSRFPQIGQPAEDPAGALARIDCRGNVLEGTVSCGPLVPVGANPDIIYGGQNLYVKLTSANPSFNSGTGAFTFDVTVQNLLPQAIGTTDGATLDPNGVRVFFASQPTASPTGTVTVQSDGQGLFTSANQDYYQYNQKLDPQAASTSKTWTLMLSGGATGFAFTVYVSAPVQFPNGWIEIYPPAADKKNPATIFADTILPLETLQLTHAIRRHIGAVTTGQTVTWTNTANGHASVDANGLVTADSTPGWDSVSVAHDDRAES
jgi:hypothetical protein